MCHQGICSDHIRSFFLGLNKPKTQNQVQPNLTQKEGFGRRGDTEITLARSITSCFSSVKNINAFKSLLELIFCHIMFDLFAGQFFCQKS